MASASDDGSIHIFHGMVYRYNNTSLTIPVMMMTMVVMMTMMLLLLMMMLLLMMVTITMMMAV